MSRWSVPRIPYNRMIADAAAPCSSRPERDWAVSGPTTTAKVMTREQPTLIERRPQRWTMLVEQRCEEPIASRTPQKKEPRPLLDGAQIGDDILSRACDPVPSALVSLTSLFGMGRGGPHRNSHLKL